MDEIAEQLKREYEKAVADTEQLFVAYKKAERAFDEARSLEDSLGRVLQHMTGEDLDKLLTDATLRNIHAHKRGRVTLLDVAGDVIRERGPMPIDQLFMEVQQRGKQTTRRSLLVTLRRARPERFNRDDDGLWFLTQRTIQKK